MSVGTWSYCPKCRNETADLLVAAHLAYGKVPMEEHERMLAAAKAAKAEGRQLREKFSFYLEGDTLHVDYEGCCQKCGLHIRLKERHMVDDIEVQA